MVHQPLKPPLRQTLMVYAFLAIEQSYNNCCSEKMYLSSVGRLNLCTFLVVIVSYSLTEFSTPPKGLIPPTFVWLFSPSNLPNSSQGVLPNIHCEA